MEPEKNMSSEKNVPSWTSLTQHSFLEYFFQQAIASHHMCDERIWPAEGSNGRMIVVQFLLF